MRRHEITDRQWEAIAPLLPPWFAKVFSGDYTLQLLSTRYGPALYLPQQLAAYRKHPGGVMQTSHNTLAQNECRIWENEQYCRNFASVLAPYFKRYLEYLYFERSEKLGARSQRMKQLYYYCKVVSGDGERLLFHTKRLMKRRRNQASGS